VKNLTSVRIEIGVDIGRIGAVRVVTGKRPVASIGFIAIVMRTAMRWVMPVPRRIADVRT
jgi:hypothetical protein